LGSPPFLGFWIFTGFAELWRWIVQQAVELTQGVSSTVEFAGEAVAFSLQPNSFLLVFDGLVGPGLFALVGPDVRADPFPRIGLSVKWAGLSYAVEDDHFRRTVFVSPVHLSGARSPLEGGEGRELGLERLEFVVAVFNGGFGLAAEFVQPSDGFFIERSCWLCIFVEHLSLLISGASYLGLATLLFVARMVFLSRGRTVCAPRGSAG
jgi:hypothetical protein